MPLHKKQPNVCRQCHRVVDGDSCALCGGGASVTQDWAGYVAIIDPENSDIALKLEVSRAGRYALKVR